MGDYGSIIIASADYEFADRLLQLLHAHEYHCDIARDFQAATIKLARNYCDLVITDINLPGGRELEIAYLVRDKFDHVPIITIVDEFHQNVSIDIIELPIVSYIARSYSDEHLFRCVYHALNYVKQQNIAKNNIESLQNWYTELHNISKATGSRSTNNMTYKNYTIITINNIMQCLNNLHRMIELSDNANKVFSCIDDCSKLNLLTQAIIDAVDILDKTRTSFKSKELGNLRKRLMDVLSKSIGRDFHTMKT